MIIIASIEDGQRIDAIVQKHIHPDLASEGVVLGDIAYEHAIRKRERTECPQDLDVEHFLGAGTNVRKSTRVQIYLRCQPWAGTHDR